MSDKSPDKLDQAYDGLERELPDRFVRAIRWLRDPASRAVRLPLGLVALTVGVFGFMIPVLGFETLLLGLLLIAQDVPFLRAPVGIALVWLEDKWVALRRWWRRRR